MAKTLEILRWACYNVDVGCRYPPKMPYMGCILLLMQPTPLTGTATDFTCVNVVNCVGCSPHPSRGRQLLFSAPLSTIFSGCSPHPSRGRKQLVDMNHARTDAAHTPHGDGSAETAWTYKNVRAVFVPTLISAPAPDSFRSWGVLRDGGPGGRVHAPRREIVTGS